MAADEPLRELERGWNYWMIAAAMAISFLGTFTATQLMIQARMSTQFATVLTWVILASLIFGFCSVWSLHFVAMLACVLDLPIGFDISLTLLSAVLAVTFTFAALGADLLWEAHSQIMQPRTRFPSKSPAARFTSSDVPSRDPSAPLLASLLAEDRRDEEWPSYVEEEFTLERSGQSPYRRALDELPAFNSLSEPFGSDARTPQDSTTQDLDVEIHEHTRRILALPGSAPELENLGGDTLVDPPDTSNSSHRSSSHRDSSSFLEINKLRNIIYRSSVPGKNAFIATYETLYIGFNRKHIMRGFLWSLALWGMHYCGLFAMEIPGGYMTLDPIYVILAEIISWLVCIVESVLMTQVEPYLSQQILFSIVATFGVAAMHFTGMRSARFYSRDPPSDLRGYPPQFPIAIVAIAITTCMLANGLLAHAATISRNKLAEIVWTRRKLWRAIAQKENAEAAAALRSEFIASASHEIRTPLHHLQGYSDLLSKTELSDEGRVLLQSIQRATKTLSLITNNVLDWSKLESDKDALCRLVALDVRSVCESVLVLLPNKDDETEVELMVVITPDVPKSLFLDETYIHRIFMNLLSNALKFTRSGYVILSLEMKENSLVAKVWDSGSGIPPTFIPLLFEPFTQAQTRGSQRGTGLGLSIVKQLLHKMQGTIEVDSRHPETAEIDPENAGTIFTVTIPIQVSWPVRRNLQSIAEIPTVAIFHLERARCLEGLNKAWELFGHNVTVVTEFSQLSNIQFDYIWADSQFLEENPDCFQRLLSQDQWTVLVPYSEQSAIRHLQGLESAPNFILLQRPLMWHTFEDRILLAKQTPQMNGQLRSVRFASEAESAGGKNKTKFKGASGSKMASVLLVEDNPINQKLGKKMLSSLGYQVLLAEDGNDAIDKTLEHDSTIDMILMDQSMPVKDGVTATREIRLLEETGKLSKRHPIIAVTAVVDSESIALFKEAGADEFLAKPLSLGRLEQTLATFLPEQ